MRAMGCAMINAEWRAIDKTPHKDP